MLVHWCHLFHLIFVFVRVHDIFYDWSQVHNLNVNSQSTPIEIPQKHTPTTPLLHTPISLLIYENQIQFVELIQPDKHSNYAALRFFSPFR